MNCPQCGCALRLVADVEGKVARSTPSPSADITGLGDLLDSISLVGLDDWDTKFVEDARARFLKYKGKTLMSEKQMKILRGIASKHDEEIPY